MFWKGRPLEQYSKEELVNIVKALALMVERQRKQHGKDLEVLSGKN